jgi:hypothetical protein
MPISYAAMGDAPENKEPSALGSILKAVWGYEKSLWRWAVVLGLIGAVLGAAVGGFFGYASYGYLGMVGGAFLGAIPAWLLATLVFYVLLSTANFSG